MKTGILEYRDFSRVELYVVFLLSALIISEMVVIFLLGKGAAEGLAKALTTAGSGFLVLVLGWSRWVYRLVGPMLFPLMILTIVEVWVIVKLLQCWRFGCTTDEEPRSFYKVLGIVEGVAPGFGFLGTCISLIFTMHHMDPSLNQTAMLKSLLDNSSSAFGSTVYGISLAITAFLSLELFKGFLLKRTPTQRPAELGRDDKEQVNAMNLIKKEA